MDFLCGCCCCWPGDFCCGDCGDGEDGEGEQDEDIEEDEDTDEWMLVGILVGWAFGRPLFGSSVDLASF